MAMNADDLLAQFMAEDDADHKHLIRDSEVGHYGHTPAISSKSSSSKRSEGASSSQAPQPEKRKNPLGERVRGGSTTLPTPAHGKRLSREAYPKAFQNMSRFFNARQDLAGASGGRGDDCHLPLPPLFEDLTEEQQQSFACLLDDYQSSSQAISETHARGSRSVTTKAALRAPVPGEWFTNHISNVVVAYVGSALDVVQPKAEVATRVAYALGKEFYTSLILEWYKSISIGAANWLSALNAYADFGPEGGGQIAAITQGPGRRAVLDSTPLTAGSEASGVNYRREKTSSTEAGTTNPSTEPDQLPAAALSEHDLKLAEAAAGFITQVSGWVHSFFTIRSREIDDETVEVSLPPTPAPAKVHGGEGGNLLCGAASSSTPSAEHQSQLSCTSLKRVQEPSVSQGGSNCRVGEGKLSTVVPARLSVGTHDTAGIFVQVESSSLSSPSGQQQTEGLPPMTTTTQGWGAPAPETTTTTASDVDSLLRQFMNDKEAQEGFESKGEPTATMAPLPPVVEDSLPNRGNGRGGVVLGTTGATTRAYEVDSAKMAPVDALMLQFMSEQDTAS